MRGRSLLFTLYGDLILPYGRDEVWIGSLIRMLGEFGVSPGAARVATFRLAQQGWLRTRQVNRRSYYALTEKGRQRLNTAIHRMYHKPAPWDGQWRVLTYTIPEQNRSVRDQLRRSLAWLGFAPLGGSTWVTPHPVSDDALDTVLGGDLKEWVVLFTARLNGRCDDSTLVHRCWNVAQVAERYQEFIAVYRPRLEALKARMAAGDVPPDNVCFVERTLLVNEYRKFLHVDPRLPRELLPDGWAGEVAEAVFWEYHQLLTPGTERFFAWCNRGGSRGRGQGGSRGGSGGRGQGKAPSKGRQA